MINKTIALLELIKDIPSMFLMTDEIIDFAQKDWIRVE